MSGATDKRVRRLLAAIAANVPFTPDAFLALDDLETGSGRRIPLWLFGFLR
ncbi:MAG: hypothetical protein JJU00_17940 [Opitutales bacterium]|nr:hypothetical protein [Opitutales bacterium]